MSSVIIKTIETQSHRIMIEEGSIVTMYSKPAHVTIDSIQESNEQCKILAKEGKLRLFVDPTEELSITSEARTYIIRNVEQYCEKVAIYTAKPYVRAIFNLIKKIDKPKIPYQMFTDKEEALEWLREK